MLKFYYYSYSFHYIVVVVIRYQIKLAQHHHIFYILSKAIKGFSFANFFYASYKKS